MLPTDISLIQSTFGRIALRKEEAAAQFYARLFELDPSLRPLFKGDITEQGRKLVATLAVAVNSLRAPEALEGVLAGLGSRHAGYGVEPRHYDTVAQALLWTLRQNLGEQWTPEAERAWTGLYLFVAEAMQRGAAQAA